MTEQEAKAAEERIAKMLDEAKRVVEEARNEAKEIKRRAKEERRKEQDRQSAARRKEKVLNLRIGSDLEDKLKSEAKRLSVPVSSLVRNVLDNAFDLVGGITENVGNLVEDVVQNAGEVKETFKTALKDCFTEQCAEKTETVANNSETDRQPIEEVAWWRKVTLGKPASCANCNVAIPRGNRAHMGLGDHNNSTLFLCDGCIENLKEPIHQQVGNV